MAIANDGLIALVGAPMANGGLGEAYTFYYGDDPWAPGTTDWYPHQRMGTEFMHMTPGTHFGTSVALSSGGSAPVGAPDADPAGEVFLYGHFYTDENWLDSGSITAPSQGSRFGASVVMSPVSDELFIGAPLALGGAGAGYVYMSNGSLEQRLEDPSPTAGAHFGASIAVAYASELLVGAPSENAGAGAAYAFDASSGGTWATPDAPLAPLADPAAGDAYGTFVAIAANRAAVLVGSPGASIVTHLSSAPVTKPDPPVTVQAVPHVGSAEVSWTAPSSNGGSPISTYTVTSAPDQLSCTVPVPAAKCTVAGLTPGTQYTFTATATNNFGTSHASLPSAAVTPAAPPDDGGGVLGGGGGTGSGGAGGGGTGAGGSTTGGLSIGGASGPGSGGGPGGIVVNRDTTPPSTPLGSLRVLRRTRTSITISWGPARDDTGVVGYRVYESLRGTWKLVGSAGLRRTFVRAALRHRTRHRLAVRAYDRAGNLSLPLIGTWTTTR